MLFKRVFSKNCINTQFKSLKAFFFLQSLFTMVVMFAVLICLGAVTLSDLLGAVGATSIASTMFIMYSMPNAPVAEPKCVVAAYCLSLVVGAICFYLARSVGGLEQHFSYVTLHQLIGAFAVGACMFFMLLFNFQHPPAVGIALGLVLDDWDHWTILVLILSVLIIVLLKMLVQAHLLDLVEK